MGKWSTILGIGKKVANHSATQTTARSIGGALVHPQRTLAGLGNATKTAVMGGGILTNIHNYIADYQCKI